MPLREIKRHRFVFLDWIPMPNRTTPAALIGSEQQPDAVFEVKAGGSCSEAVRRFLEVWLCKDSEVKAAQRDAILGPALKKFENEPSILLVDRWLKAPRRTLAAAIDQSGLIGIVIDELIDEPGHTDVVVDEENAELREQTRNDCKADTMAMVVIQLLRMMVAEIHASHGWLQVVTPPQLARFSVTRVAVDPIAVATKQFSDIKTAVDACRRLLQAKTLCEVEAEAAGPGGAASPSPSAEAFLALSTRFGALVDQFLPFLSANEAHPSDRQTRAHNAARRYRCWAIAIAIMFFATTLLPIFLQDWVEGFDQLLPKDLSAFIGSSTLDGIPASWRSATQSLYARFRDGHAMSTTEYIYFFIALFVVSVVMYWSVFCFEDRELSQSKSQLSDGRVRQVLGWWPSASHVRRLVAWWAFDTRLIFSLLFLSFVTLSALWFALAFFVNDGEWRWISEESPRVSLRIAYRGLVWGLPVVSLGFLKTGHDRLATLVEQMIDQEYRKSVLEELSEAVTLGKRFTTNIKAYFENLKDRAPYNSILSRLLTFQHAPEDIDKVRRALTAGIERAKADHARRALMTGTLAFIFTTQGLLSKLEPSASRENRPERMQAQIEQLSRDAEKVKAIQGATLWSAKGGNSDSLMKLIDGCKVMDERGKERKGWICSESEKAEWIKAHFALRNRKNDEPKPQCAEGDASCKPEVTVRLDPASLAELQSRLGFAARTAVTWGLDNVGTTEFERKLRVAVELAFERANADGVKPQTQAAVKQAIDKAIEAAFAGGLKEPVRTQMIAAIEEAIDLSDYRGLGDKAGRVIDDIVKKAVDEVFVGELVTRIRPQIIEAIVQALQQRYQYQAFSKEDLRKAVEEAIASSEPIQVDLDEPIVATIERGAFVPGVPEHCTKRGRKIASFYFRKLSDPSPNCTTYSDCEQSACLAKIPPANFDDNLIGEVENRCEREPHLDSGDDPLAKGPDFVERILKDARTALRNAPRGEILVVGYSNSTGMPTTNLWVSASRAETIRNKLEFYCKPRKNDPECAGFQFSAIGRGEEIQSSLMPPVEPLPMDSLLSRRADVWACSLSAAARMP